MSEIDKCLYAFMSGIGLFLVLTGLAEVIG